MNTTAYTNRAMLSDSNPQAFAELPIEGLLEVYQDSDATAREIELAERLEDAEAEVQYLREQVLSLIEQLLQEPS